MNVDVCSGYGIHAISSMMVSIGHNSSESTKLTHALTLMKRICHMNQSPVDIIWNSALKPVYEVEGIRKVSDCTDAKLNK